MNWEEKPTAAAHGGAVMELPLGCATPNFNLEKAVCSHGLFMMAPNHWDSHSKTLRRPLRLNNDDDETSCMVEISHPSHSPDVLCLRAIGADLLSPQQQHCLLSQVRRMLRLSEEENRRVKEFHEAHKELKKRGFGRVFRSPTLFEDMIKCILLCNCQWSRTLSMVQALCELQFEMQHFLKSETEHFVPKTPVGKDSKRKSGARRKCVTNLSNRYSEIQTLEETEVTMPITTASNFSHETGNFRPISSSETKERSFRQCNSLQTSTNGIGNFPSPRELASLDEKFLMKRCNLGYRAGRILNLAREIVEGKHKLTELEYSCDTTSSSSYDKLAEQLKAINGFGPFTTANVLMCMGFYHVIPTDSETIRHLKQVHGKITTIRTVEKDVNLMYGKYAPFQFLAYWSEVWHFYEELFGNLSEMHPSSYKLITAANMRPKKANNRSKRQKVSDVTTIETMK